ncbi:hypothetical protein [Streptomyces sp. UG1]|uniref:hypothetical protein n=1 Tax=Streptomyces sp. UG1 TaxID=3417652 RepID=UPI003CFA9227
MKWILFGAVLGVLLLYPSLLAVVIGVAAAIASQPVLVVFGLGLVAGVRVRRARRWAR